MPTASSLPQAVDPAPATNQPKPCCVCKDEKEMRDECMLFSTSKDPQSDCQTTIEKYRHCMKGFGFKV